MTFWMWNARGVSEESQTGNRICYAGLSTSGSGGSPMAPVLASAAGMSPSQEQGVALVHMVESFLQGDGNTLLLHFSTDSSDLPPPQKNAEILSGGLPSSAPYLHLTQTIQQVPRNGITWVKSTLSGDLAVFIGPL